MWLSTKVVTSKDNIITTGNIVCGVILKSLFCFCKSVPICYFSNKYRMSLTENEEPPEVDAVCELLDRIILKQLHLLEEKMHCEMNIESSINNGTIHLAKSRYIMGQSSVSATRLPMESSPEFSASTVCETVQEDGVKQLRVVENDSDNIVNPIRWFGVLVPQNLHKAQSIFQNTINFVVECANVQLQIIENCKNIDALKTYKKLLEFSKNGHDDKV